MLMDFTCSRVPNIDELDLENDSTLKQLTSDCQVGFYDKFKLCSLIFVLLPGSRNIALECEASEIPQTVSQQTDYSIH